MIAVGRKEIKYILPVETLSALSQKLDVLLDRDRNGRDGVYTVRSQYYDSIWDRDLRDNLSGLMEKQKIRLRIYSSEDQTAKLEYKCKSGEDGEKLSLTVTRQEALEMEGGRYAWLVEREEPLASYLYARMNRWAYVPKTIVEYRRLAYSSSVSSLRITMDTQIRGTMYPYGLFDERPQYVPLMEEDLGILEVKYDRFLPDHIRQALRDIDHMAESNSKYTRARLLL